MYFIDKSRVCIVFHYSKGIDKLRELKTEIG